MSYIDGISVRINQLNAKLIETINIPAGTKNKMRVKFELIGDVWDTLFPKIAVFRALSTTGRDVVREAAIINGYAVIPAEILSDPHNLISAGVKMVDEDGGQVSTNMVTIGKTGVGAAKPDGDTYDPLDEFLTEFAKISAEHFETSTQKIKDYAKEIIPSFEDWFHYNARHTEAGVHVQNYEDLFSYNVFDDNGELIETIDLLENAQHGEAAFVRNPSILVRECPKEERNSIIVKKDAVYTYLQLCRTLDMPSGLEDGKEYVLEFEAKNGIVVTMKICKSETEPWHIEVSESDCDSKSYYYWEDHKAQDGIVHFTAHAGVWFESIGNSTSGERIISEDGTVYYRESHWGVCLSRTLFDVKCINDSGADKFKKMFADRPHAIINDSGYYVFDGNQKKWIWSFDLSRHHKVALPLKEWGWNNRRTIVFYGIKPEEDLKLSLESGECEGVIIAEPRTENLITFECETIPQGDIVLTIGRPLRR